MLNEKVMNDLINYIKDTIKDNKLFNIKNILIYLKQNNIELTDIDALILLNEIDCLKNLIKYNKCYFKRINDVNLNVLVDVYNDEIKTKIEDKVEGISSTRMYLNEISDIPLLTREEEIDLSNKAKLGDKDAYDKLVIHNLKLSVYFANKYAKKGYDFDELIQSGNLGLMEAVKRFDSSKNYKFNTYATYWIFRYIYLYIYNYHETIRIPINTTNKFNRIYKERQKYIQEYGYDPSNDELSILTSLPLKDIENSKYYSNIQVSLYEPINDDESDRDTIEDRISSSKDEAEDIVDKVYIDSLIKMIDENPKIKDRDRDILYMRHGVNYNRPYQLKEIAKKYNMTTQRVEQIIQRCEKLSLSLFKSKRIKLELKNL